MGNKEETEEIVFDDYAKTYKAGLQKTLKVSGLSPNYFHHYKVRELYNYLKDIGKEKAPMKILDFGCGVGCSEPFLSHYFPQSEIYACDLSEESVNCAKAENSKRKNIRFARYDGENLPFGEKFDVVFVANVFHHIPRKLQQKTLDMLKESLNKNGFLIIFEHNPYNPATVALALMTDYRYDKNTNLLTPIYMRRIMKEAGFANIRVTYKIFFPGFLKRLIPLEKYLKDCPFGAHYFCIAK